MSSRTPSHSLPAVSHRMQAVQSPIIPIIGEWLRTYPDAISLGQGVVFYAPPLAALRAACDYPPEPAAHHYGAVEGRADLHAIIRRKLATDNAVHADDRQRIIVTAGSNMGFMNALFAITDPGDEIILLSPYYFNHEMAIRMLDCTCVAVPTDAHYQPDLAAIEAAITPRTRAIVTVSPNNPTGAVYPRETLAGINELCRHHGLFHISDEAYEYFLYDGTEHCSPASLPGAADHTISLFSLSKAYGFAGWRIGYMLIPARLTEAVKKAQDTCLICPTLVAQQAAVAALEQGADYCRSYLQQLTATRARVLEELRRLEPACECPAAAGAFYILLRVHTPLDSMTLAHRLVSEHGVAVVPGQTFGCMNGCYLRISYGALEGQAALAGLERLVTGLSALVSH
ncbi:MAG: pyridoxal phosphate-dependent aminotransferase [Gammaproteobacteria bacterium]|nr:pyridoxal phosphate-dependent aminotransferase [Gammaproteobacteria bacterium]